MQTCRPQSYVQGAARAGAAGGPGSRASRPRATLLRREGERCHRPRHLCLCSDFLFLLLKKQQHLEAGRPGGEPWRGGLRRPGPGPGPAPARARIPADPIWSLPAGARGGLGCAFLRAFLPGISAGTLLQTSGELSPQLWVANLGVCRMRAARGAGPEGLGWTPYSERAQEPLGSGERKEPAL